MSLKDNYDQYKQRKEAQRYFRAHNDQFLDSSRWIKVIIYGLISAIAVGAVLGVLITYAPITMVWFYIISGYFVAMAINKAAGVKCQQAGYGAVIFTFLSYVFSIMTMYTLSYMSAGLYVGITGLLSFIVPSLKYIFTGNIIGTILMLVGLYEAYMMAK